MEYYAGQITKEEFERYRQEFLLTFGVIKEEPKPKNTGQEATKQLLKEWGIKV